MTDLLKTAERLEQRIAAAGDSGRLALQPEFSDLLHRMRLSGVTVPARLWSLDAALTEEAIEARFDNMPL